MESNLTVRKLLPCLIIFLILVPTLDSQSLWWDEGISIHLATSSWSTIVVNRAGNIHPPLYFFALKLWVTAVGSTPFSTRYLSALATMLLPAAIYALFKHRLDERSALTASFLVSVAPPFIIYGQEVRAYAFLPLFFVVLIGQIWEIEHPNKMWDSLSPRRRGIILGITQILFVGFHYTGLVAVALSDFYILVKSIIRKSESDRRVLINSITTLIMVAVPWLVVVAVLRLEGVFNQAGISNPFADPIPFGYLLKLLAVFNAVGMPEALNAVHINRSLTVTALLVLTVFLLRMLKPKRQKILFMLVIWLFPFSCVPFIWLLSPQSHPRYLLPYFLGGWLMVAVLSSQPTVAKGLRLFLLAATLVSAILGLESYLFNETYARSDIRAVALDLQEHASPGDIVFIPNTDWSLPQYDIGNATVHMAPSPQDEQTVANYIAALKEPAYVFLVDYERDALDPRGYVRYLLSRQGYLAERYHFHKVFMERYAISQPYTPINVNLIAPVCVEGEDLCLYGKDMPVQAVSGSMLPIALCWRTGTVNKRYALAFRLYTESGILVSSGDDLLLDSDVRPSDLWVENTSFCSYHRLPLPLGLLPEFYKLEMSIYSVDAPTFSVPLITHNGEHVPVVEISRIKPSRTIWVDTSPETVMSKVTLNPTQAINGLTLSGSNFEPAVVAPGGNIYITLLWHVEEEGIQEIVPQLVMIQDERVLARVNTWGAFGQMPLNRPILDHAVMPVPVDAKSGDVDLQLIVGSSGQEIYIGSVYLEAIEHVFDVPQPQYTLQVVIPNIATLIGYDIAPGMVVKSGQPFTVTLLWRAEENAAKNDLKVFVHLVDGEGNVVAQHDAKPVNWMRPTNGWLAGEILTDSHQLQWLKTQAGTGEILIGLYDAGTGTRLLWDNGEDALKLPLRIDY